MELGHKRNVAQQIPAPEYQMSVELSKMPTSVPCRKCRAQKSVPNQPRLAALRGLGNNLKGLLALKAVDMKILVQGEDPSHADRLT